MRIEQQLPGEIELIQLYWATRLEVKAVALHEVQLQAHISRPRVDQELQGGVAQQVARQQVLQRQHWQCEVRAPDCAQLRHQGVQVVQGQHLDHGKM